MYILVMSGVYALAIINVNPMPPPKTRNSERGSGTVGRISLV